MVGLRFAAALLTGLWLTLLPIYLFVLHMSNEGFFSYDFFSEGVFGLKTFLLFLLILILLLSAYLWGFVFFGRWTYMRRKQGKPYRGPLISTLFFLVISIATHYLIWAYAPAAKRHLPAFSLLGFFLIAAAASFVGGDLRSKLLNWIPSAIFVVASALFPLMNIAVTSDLVGLGLANFNMGGGIPAQIVATEKEATVLFSGSLLLLTPGNAYFREGKHGFRLCRQSDKTVVVVSDRR